MRAVRFDAPGDADALFLGEAPMPVCGVEDLLVRVEATALNRADLLQRRGAYPPPPGASEILGLEVAGTVEAVGVSCEGYAVGDRVCGLLSGGGYAEYAALPYGLAMPIPPRLSAWEAAAIPEVFLTAYQALFWLGRLEAGRDVLIHAGASGVGTAAIQLVQAAGSRALVTASAAKHETCLTLGAALAVDYRTEDFAECVLEFTEGRGVDLVIDVVGAAYLASNVRALAVDGCIVVLALMGGRRLDDFDMGPFFRKRARLVASTLRNRSLAYKIDLTRAFLERMGPLLEDGRLVPVIDSVYDWTEVQAAHQRMEANANAGKIVLRIGR